MTALQQQYTSIKRRFLEYFLFFKMGDFYELWYEDAIEAVKILGITLTKRLGIPMCGIPVQSIDFYVKKLIKESHKPVAICDQKEGKVGNIVERDVVQLYTKGTYVDINNPNNNFILSIAKYNDVYTLIYVDLGTEETYKETIAEELLISHLYIINPTEIIINSSVNMDLLEEWMERVKYSKCENAEDILMKYLADLGYHMDLKPVEKQQHMIKMSAMTLYNLEVFHDLYHNTKHSLINVLNQTSCAMGYRTLRNFLSNPLCNRMIIESHYDAIDYFVKLINNKKNIRFPVGDLEKLINRLNDPKTMLGFMESIDYSLKLIKGLDGIPDFLKVKIDEVADIAIHNHVLEVLSESPGHIGNGRVFKDNQQANALNDEHNKVLTEIHQLPQTLNINAKVRNNSLVGFFLESKTTLPDLILKQKSNNLYRYTNDRLLNLEQQLFKYEQQIKQVEHQLFQELQQIVQNHKPDLLKLIKLIGLIDYYNSCAIISLKNDYHRPQIVEEKLIEMLDSRHPVIENEIHVFIKNHIILNEEKQIMLITGPNMGGKSTILRQCAINLLMAHCGMFTSSRLRFSILSGLFVRLGANDRIHKGESTFKVEMLECGEILNLADENSLIIMDEVGRGTSTQDGMSISFSIIEYIHDKLRCFNLISTHYNELSRLENNLSRLVNKQMMIDKSYCTYRLIDGISTNSFGIMVASQSNLPQSIINQAKDYSERINVNISIKDYEDKVKIPRAPL